ASVTLNCGAAFDTVVVRPAEYAILRNAVVGYNAKIQAVAAANNWAYWNPNPVLDSLRVAGQIPLFPNIATANVGFGPWISLDGVHPSAAAHKLIANYMRQVINTRYTTTIPAIP
ncbi:MAG: SGNH/GDSL hydrolase family protein, partial [Gemmatimonadota bacterium]